MSAADVPQGKGRGHWQRVIIDEFGDAPCHSAIIWCPDCGRILALQRGHVIAPNGQVTPSVGHPPSYPACPWHVHPRLVGWEHLPPPEPKPVIANCAHCGKPARQLGGWGTWNAPGIICVECRVLTGGVKP